jgi:Zn-dependent protease with chaperone function
LLDTFRTRVFSPEIDAGLLAVAGISSLGAFVTLRFQRAMRLKADTLAAKVTGKDSFLEVLRKIETAGRSSSRSRVGEWAVRLFTTQPSPKERVARLKKSK